MIYLFLLGTTIFMFDSSSWFRRQTFHNYLLMFFETDCSSEGQSQEPQPEEVVALPSVLPAQTC